MTKILTPRDKQQNFLVRLNKPVSEKEVKINAFAKNAKYIPISYIEMKLDKFFFGLWETVNFRHEVIVNELVGTIELRVKHPVTGEWLTRTGAAGVPIQMEKGSGVNDVQRKIHNTLVKDYPHLKAMCILNAAKSLGKLFGRDLNREFEDEYQPFLNLPQHDPITGAQVQLIDNLLNNCTLGAEEVQSIEFNLLKMDKTEAGHLIERLQEHQLETLDEAFKRKLITE